jgi:hypothetical protein
MRGHLAPGSILVALRTGRAEIDGGFHRECAGAEGGTEESCSESGRQTNQGYAPPFDECR